MSEFVIRPEASLVLGVIRSAMTDTSQEGNLRTRIRDKVTDLKIEAAQALIDGDLKVAKTALTEAVSAEAALAVVMFIGVKHLEFASDGQGDDGTSDDGEGSGEQERAPESDGDQNEVPDIDPEALEGMNRKELLEVAKEIGLQGLSQAKRDDIELAILEALDASVGGDHPDRDE